MGKRLAVCKAQVQLAKVLEQRGTENPPSGSFLHPSLHSRHVGSPCSPVFLGLTAIDSDWTESGHVPAPAPIGSFREIWPSGRQDLAMGLVGGRDRACPVGLHAAAVLALPAARVALWPSPARVLRLRRARRAGALRGGPRPVLIQETGACLSPLSRCLTHDLPLEARIFHVSGFGHLF